MSERARERRRSEGHHRAALPPADLAVPYAALLALQRSAGNQAVQRLIYTQSSKQLRVPKSYADEQIPWEGSYLANRPVKADDPTFLQLANKDSGALLPHVAAGLDVRTVEKVAAVDDAQMATGAAKLADSSAAQGTDVALQRVIPARDQVLVYPGPPVKYYGADELDSHFVLQPKDFFPEKPDLPGAGHGVRAPVPSAVKGQLLWNLVCVLIALVKADGYGPVQQLTNQAVSTLDDAVQALHDHYVTEGVQYDDTSTRFRVMNDWGYKPIFSGQSPWNELPQHVTLNQGTYIFDIVGHTVKVEVLQNIAHGDPQIANLGQYFRCHSERDNYRTSEFLKDVTYVWAK